MPILPVQIPAELADRIRGAADHYHQALAKGRSLYKEYEKAIEAYDTDPSPPHDQHDHGVYQRTVLPLRDSADEANRVVIDAYIEFAKVTVDAAALVCRAAGVDHKAIMDSFTTGVDAPIAKGG